MAGGEGGWRRGYLFELCWLVLSFIVRPPSSSSSPPHRQLLPCAPTLGPRESGWLNLIQSHTMYMVRYLNVTHCH
jgi:hypothetical protein